MARVNFGTVMLARYARFVGDAQREAVEKVASNMDGIGKQSTVMS
jgi:hypothetical protein